MDIIIIHAREDRPYCIKLAEFLDYIMLWFYQKDEGEPARSKEMQQRLAWCEAVVLLISENALASQEWRRDLQMAREAAKPIIPVLISPHLCLPKELGLTGSVDLSSGLTVSAMHDLLRALHAVEHDAAPPRPVSQADSMLPVQQAAEPEKPRTEIEQVVQALENGDYARALELIDTLQANGTISKFIDLDALRALAQSALNRKKEQREMEREYRDIHHLLKADVTRAIGINAFRRFRSKYPHYDPDGLSCYLGQTRHQSVSLLERLNRISAKVPLLEWREVPAGRVRIHTGERDPADVVEAFLMTRYPITNLQYSLFVKAPNGYCDPRWWDFAPEARAWRESAPHPKQPQFKGEERPREKVNWYDARAFCSWLGHILGAQITLPTLRQRQRAIMGDDDRSYPWGSDFDPARCNTYENGLKMTTPVTEYPNGASPYDIYDLVGNTWEWCLDTVEKPASEAGEPYHVVIHGGAFQSKASRAHVTYSLSVPPLTQHSSIGFRAVALMRH